MPDPVGFQLGEKLSGALIVEVFDTVAATRCDDLEFLRMNLEKPRHKRTTPPFEVAQHAHLIGESFLSLRSPKGLMHPAIVADADLRPQSILNLVHA
jgi:hypothetical protein